MFVYFHTRFNMKTGLTCNAAMAFSALCFDLKLIKAQNLSGKHRTLATSPYLGRDMQDECYRHQYIYILNYASN